MWLSEPLCSCVCPVLQDTYKATADCLAVFCHRPETFILVVKLSASEKIRHFLAMQNELNVNVYILGSNGSLTCCCCLEMSPPVSVTKSALTEV